MLFDSQVKEASGYMMHSCVRPLIKWRSMLLLSWIEKALEIILQKLNADIKNKTALWLTPENLFQLFSQIHRYASQPGAIIPLLQAI